MDRRVSSAAPSHDQYLQTRFFSSLDGLRFLCIAAVLIHHSPRSAQSWPIAERGFLGVDMFFVLSGFLIVTLILRERDQFGEISLKAFYVRRCLRIFPIYFIYVFALLAVAPFMSESSHLRSAVGENWIHLLTFTVNYGGEQTAWFGHLWSLSVEEQFYLIWPFLEWKAQRWLRPILVLMLLTCVLRDAGILASVSPFLNASPFSRSLVWGVALAWLLHSRRGYDFAARIFGGRWASLLTGLVLMVILAQPGLREGPKAISTSILLACFVAAIVIRPDHVLASFFRFSPVAYLGAISYGIYLYHISVAAIVKSLVERVGLEASSLPYFVIYLGALVAISALSFEFPIAEATRPHVGILIDTPYTALPHRNREFDEQHTQLGRFAWRPNPDDQCDRIEARSSSCCGSQQRSSFREVLRR